VNQTPSADEMSGPCPISPTVSAVFGKWSAEVLWSLMHTGPLRYTQLRAQIPGVTPKVLTQRLRQLERDGLVSRTYYREVPPRVEYEATEMARSLAPLFADLERWTHTHAPSIAAARRAYQGPTIS
jgi:DNA-binding HxlR family transcriptional regulator